MNQEERMSEEESSPPKTFKIFVIGALIGAGMGLLYAPRSGKETRKLLAKRGKLLKDRAQDSVETAQEFIKDRKADVVAIFESGQDAVAPAKPKRS